MVDGLGRCRIYGQTCMPLDCKSVKKWQIVLCHHILNQTSLLHFVAHFLIILWSCDQSWIVGFDFAPVTVTSFFVAFAPGPRLFSLFVDFLPSMILSYSFVSEFSLI